MWMACRHTLPRSSEMASHWVWCSLSLSLQCEICSSFRLRNVLPPPGGTSWTPRSGFRWVMLSWRWMATVIPTRCFRRCPAQKRFTSSSRTNWPGFSGATSRTPWPPLAPPSADGTHCSRESSGQSRGDGGGVFPGVLKGPRGNCLWLDHAKKETWCIQSISEYKWWFSQLLLGLACQWLTTHHWGSWPIQDPVWLSRKPPKNCSTTTRPVEQQPSPDMSCG